MNKPKKINTIIGLVEREHILDFMALAGLKYDKENKQWNIKLDTMKVKKKTEEGYKTIILRTPARMMNMQYALHLMKGDTAKAMQFVRENLISQGQPVYLPNYLGEYDKSYSSILKEIENQKYNNS